MPSGYKIIGAPELTRKLKKLDRTLQGKAIRPPVRAAAKRAKERVLQNLRGHPVQVRTGRTLAAFEEAPIRAASRERGEVRIGHVLPTRESLGIASDDPYYYPMAIEFGHARAPAYPFIRPAIDGHKRKEREIIAREIGARVEALAKTL